VTAGGPGSPADEPVPEWHDEYLDAVADRLAAHYDLDKDVHAGGERFDLHGRLRIENRKQFVVPSLTYGHHESIQHLLLARRDRATTADCEALVETAEGLADGWIDPDERHFSTEFVLGLVVPTVAPAVREFVAGFERRTLLTYGYHGHYEIRLVVVAPGERTAVASPDTDVAEALRTWASLADEGTEGENGTGIGDGLVARLRGLVSRRP
jgi:hypothetical protein